MAKMKSNPTPAELDNDALSRRRGDLVLQLADGNPADRKDIEAALDQVESEVYARRRVTERAKVARVAREQREHDERLAARDAERQEASTEMTRLSGEREQAGRAIDEAMSALGAAIRQWKAIGLKMADTGRVLGVDGFLVTHHEVLVAKLNWDLALLLPHSNFQRWEHSDREKTFVEIDAPLCAWIDYTPSPEEEN